MLLQIIFYSVFMFNLTLLQSAVDDALELVKQVHSFCVQNVLTFCVLIAAVPWPLLLVVPGKTPRSRVLYLHRPSPRSEYFPGTS
jgi:hypothetical protein